MVIHTLNHTVDIFNPDPETISIYDIARSLSNICRFNGHVTHFYSVAEHSIRVSRETSRLGGDPLLGLLHDSAEAYMQDIVSSIKPSLAFALEDGHVESYSGVEDNLVETILGKYLDSYDGDWKIVKLADNKVLAKELSFLREVRTLPPKEAYEAFLDEFLALGGKLSA